MYIYFRCSEKVQPITFNHLRNKVDILRKSWISLQSSISTDDKLFIIYDAVSDETLKFLDKTCNTDREFIKVPEHTFNYHLHTLYAFKVLKTQLEKSKDSSWHFMCEDDYLFVPDALNILRKTQQYWGNFIIFYDMPLWYKQGLISNIIIGHDRHWRLVNSSTMTTIARTKIWKKYIDLILQNSILSNDKIFEQIYKETPCIAPMPALGTHLAQGQISPIVNWNEIWNSIQI